MFRTDHKRALRSNTGARALILTVGFVAACGGSDSKSDPDAGGSNGPDGSTPVDASTPDTGTIKTDAATDGGKSDAAVVDAGIGTAPTLTTVTATQVGLSGSDLRIDFTGSDPDKDIKLVQFSVFDSANRQVGTDYRLPIATPITGISGTSHALQEGALGAAALMGHTDFKTVRVSLLDSRGVASDDTEVTIAVQTEVALGGSCDPTFLTNRCMSGLGCKGATAKTCSAGEAPTVASVGYYNDVLGPRILIVGSDPDGDVKTFTLRYLDASGQPVVWDDDNDSTTPPSGSFTGPVGSAEGMTDFFSRFAPSDAFLSTVAKVGITVNDSRATANSSAEKISNSVGPAPIKGSGATCDPRGFDFCSGTLAAPLVCAPNGASNRCTAVATARTNACNAAATLNPSTGNLSVQGSVALVSLWDQPVGCSASSAPEPDALVKLVLTEPATKVTLSTDTPYTSFDTELYVLRSCTDTPSIYDPRTGAPMDLWCNDNQQASNGDITNVKSVLVLNNLAAGTYFIVVDSSPSADLSGSLFEVDVTVE
ncbi:MAG: hypothetical protein JWN04_2368 [Myxococcaceae bacterium]|nr:hypothetical protein [Myxococcaceae bacterium]